MAYAASQRGEPVAQAGPAVQEVPPDVPQPSSHGTHLLSRLPLYLSYAPLKGFIGTWSGVGYIMLCLACCVCNASFQGGKALSV